jgi:type IV pilus assembly protein PilM
MRWLTAPLPDAAVQIAPEHVSVAVLGSRGGEAVVQGFAIEPLTAGAVVASLTAQNVVSPRAVVDALRRALDRVGVRPRRVGLVLPDPAARVSLVRFEKVPARREDLDQLIRWQIRKAAPFPIEEAALTFDVGAHAADGATDFIVVIARQDIVREYESVCEEAGMHAGLVEMATLSVLNLFFSPGGAASTAPATTDARGGGDGPGDWLVIHAQPEYTSVVILRGQEVLFFRNKGASDDENLPDMVHQTTMYYQDRLAGEGFSRVLIGGVGKAPGALDAMKRSVEARLAVTAETIDPTRAASLTDRISASPDVLATLAPLIGLLVRTRAESVSA